MTGPWTHRWAALRSGAMLALALAGVLAVAAPARAEQVVQVPLGALLDGRSVSTLTGGAVVGWTDGIDLSDGFMTIGAALSLNQTGPGMPDDGVFPANADHPEIDVHASNAAPATSAQSHVLTGVASVDVAVPPAIYSKVFLSMASAIGDSPLAITLTYADQTTTTVNVTLPDWGTGKPLPTTPPVFFTLIAGLHKWTKAGMSVDTPSHGITALLVSPAPDRTLTSLHIAKMTATPRLTLFAATGVAASAVAASPDGGGDARASADGGQDAAVVADADAAAAVTVADGSDREEAGGPTGSGGAGSSGAAGSTAPPRASSSGGCALGGASGPSGSLGLALVALASSLHAWRRSRHRRSRARRTREG